MHRKGAMLLVGTKKMKGLQPTSSLARSFLNVNDSQPMGKEIPQ